MSSQRVIFRVNAACDARLLYSTNADLSGGTYTATQTISAAPFVFDDTLTGLSADTKYYCRGETDGRLTGDVGSFTTSPGSGSAQDFSFVTGSCSQSLSTGANWDNMLTHNPLFLLDTGDLHYEDPATNSPSTVRGYYDTKVLGNLYRPKWVLKDLPIEYIWDGHDCFSPPEDTTALPASQQVFREYFPHRSLEVSDGIYRAFTIGRVRFIILDLYSHRSAESATDDASKTMLGTTQKAWFKSELDDAESVHGCPLTLAVSTWPLNTSSLRWANYSTERAELLSYIVTNGYEGNVCWISGDDHALSMDDGTNMNSLLGCATPVLQSAPIDRSENNRTSDGTYSEGTLASGSYFTVVTITDNGTSITMNWSGRNTSNTEVMSLSLGPFS